MQHFVWDGWTSLQLLPRTMPVTFHICFMSHTIQTFCLYGMSYALTSVSVQTGKHLLVCEPSVWIMTPCAECLFTVPPKECQFKEGRMKDGLLLALSSLFEGWQAATIHTCWEWRTDQESNMCCGWKIYLEGVCVLNWIRKLRERNHKQTGIHISLKLRTGMHNAAPCT